MCHVEFPVAVEHLPESFQPAEQISGVLHSRDSCWDFFRDFAASYAFMIIPAAGLFTSWRTLPCDAYFNQLPTVDNILH